MAWSHVDYCVFISCLDCSFWHIDVMLNQFQICFNEETNSCTSWMAWGWIFIFVWTIPLIHLQLYHHTSQRHIPCLEKSFVEHKRGEISHFRRQQCYPYREWHRIAGGLFLSYSHSHSLSYREPVWSITKTVNSTTFSVRTLCHRQK